MIKILVDLCFCRGLSIVQISYPTTKGMLAIYRKLVSSRMVHTELVALFVIAVEVDSTGLKHPFGNYALSKI